MTPQDYKERNEIIYRMRVEEKKKLKEIGDHFGISSERIRCIIAKLNRTAAMKAAMQKRRDAAPPNSLAMMHNSLGFERRLLREMDWSGPFDESAGCSVDVIEFMEKVPAKQMMAMHNIGKKTMKLFTDEAATIVGAEAVQRWLDGKPPRG